MESNHLTADNVLMRHATAIAIGTMTVLMLLMAVIFWRQNETSEDAQKGLSHTYEVIGHIGLLFSKLKYAEVGQRGFILTGNADYLDPYNAALKDGSNLETGQRSLQPHRSIHQELVLIRTLTTDNPVQQSNLDEMDETVTRLLAYWGTSIQERKKHGAKPLGVKLEFLRVKELMDHVGSLVRIMETEEHHLLRIRTDEADHTAQRRNLLTLIIMIMFYIAIVLSIWLYQRSHERMREKMLHDTLELQQQHEESLLQQEELKQ